MTPHHYMNNRWKYGIYRSICNKSINHTKYNNIQHNIIYLSSTHHHVLIRSHGRSPSIQSIVTSTLHNNQTSTAPSVNPFTPQPHDPTPSYLPQNKLLRYIIYFTVAGVAVYIIPPLHWCITTIQRFLRTLYTMAAVAIDYKYFFMTHRDDTQIDYNDLLSQVHERSADRILYLCMSNKGLYIKTGQYMASMNHVLPPEYLNKLKVLQDQAPSISFDTVTQVICNELNITQLSDKFQYFHRTPLAAASLAQVHYAISNDNRELAIKIQYPQLRTDFVVDMIANYLVLTLGGKLFYNFPMSWLHDELKSNLIKELDFCVEGQNADRCRQQLLDGNVRNVRVPIVHWDLSNTRVLALEYIHGMKINDTVTQLQYGIHSKSAVQLSIQALSEQIFLHGFVHCDPHPGNIFVRPTNIQYKHPIATQAQHTLQQYNMNNNNDVLPGTELLSDSIAADNTQTTVHNTMSLPSSTQFEIILLDHGLYREISEFVRLSYCKLWEALILHDDQRVIKYCAELGVNNHWVCHWAN